jgi:hypothetical protein
MTLIYALFIAGTAMALIRWAFVQGKEVGTIQAMRDFRTKIEDYSEEFLTSYLDAHDLDRLKWRKGEVEAYTRGLRVANRLACERVSR